jgi:tetratricopeptide (TPR) repeat protein
MRLSRALPALLFLAAPARLITAQGECPVETLTPAVLTTVTLTVNRAVQSDSASAPKALRDAMKGLSDEKKFAANLVGAGFLKAQIYVLWMHQAGTAETMTLEQLGVSLPKGQPNQSVDLARAADSLLKAVEAAGPACAEMTLQWRQSKPWTDRINRAYTAFGAGNIDSASYWAERASLLYATSPFVHNINAQLASAKGDTPTMLAQLRLAVAAAAKDTSLAETEKQLRFQLASTAQTYAMTGGAAQKAALNAEALALFQGLLESYPGTMDGTYAFSAGSEIVQMQGDSVAMRAFLAPLVASPAKYTDLTLLLGAEMARASQRSADAIALYSGALAKNANIRDANYFLAFLYYEAKQADKMLPLTDRLITIDPSNGDNYLMKAYAYQLLVSAEKDAKKKAEYQRVQDSLSAEEGKLAAAHKMQITRFERRPQGAALGGAVENLAKVARPFTVTVEFMDSTGVVLETMTAEVPETAPGARGEFSLEPTKPGIVAFRYRPLVMPPPTPARQTAPAARPTAPVRKP